VMGYECNTQLIERYREGDIKALEVLIEINLPLVYSVGKTYFNRGIEQDDIIQIGCLGLMKAVHNYDKGYNTQFSTYASYLIEGEIRRHIRDDWPIKVSRSIKAKARLVYKAKQELSRELMRDPSWEEVSLHTGMDIKEIDKALDSTRRPQYLHGVIHDEGGTPITLIDQLSKKKSSGVDIVDEIALRIALESLKENLGKVIRLRYFQDMTQSQVADIIGVSQVQVSRLEMKAKKLMKKKLM